PSLCGWRLPVRSGEVLAVTLNFPSGKLGCSSKSCRSGRDALTTRCRTIHGRKHSPVAPPGSRGVLPGDAKVQFMFGDYVLDPGRRELSRRAEVVPVGPQVFDL